LPQIQPWVHMPGHSRSPRGMVEGTVSPRDILTHIDDVVSVMERELTNECTSFKHLMNALPAKDQQLEEKILELQQDIARAETFHKDSNRQSRMHSEKIAQLEQQIAEMMKKDSQYRNRIEELEKEVGVHEADKERALEMNVLQHNKITELESLLSTSHETEQRHLQQIAELSLCCSNQKLQMDSLEDDISHLRLAREDAEREQESSRAEISRLGHLLREAELLVSHANKEHDSQVSKVKELELLLKEARAFESTHKHQILELEQLLFEARATEQSHVSRHQSQRSMIADLESRLTNQESAEDCLKRHKDAHTQVVSALEAQLLEARTSADSHSKSSQSLRARVSGLEQQLHEAQLASEKQIMQTNSHQKRSMELQQEIVNMSEGVDLNRKQEAVLRRKIADLEEELLTKHATNSNIHSLERQLESIAVELKEERRVTSQLRMISDSVRLTSETVVLDAETALNSEMKLKAELEAKLQKAMDENLELQENREIREMKLQKTMDENRQLHELQELRELQTENAVSQGSDIRAELEMKIEDLMQRNRELESQRYGGRDTRSIMSSHGAIGGPLRSPPRLAAALTSPRFTRSCERSLREIESSVPYCNHFLTARTKHVLQTVAAMVQKYITLQVRYVAFQVALSDKHANSSYTTRLRYCSQNDELQGELQSMDSSLEEHIQSLKDLLSEVEVNRDCPRHDRRELANALRTHLKIYDDEQQLLREARMGVFSELPVELVKSLISMRRRESSDLNHACKALHMAAEHGRRDIVEYVLAANPDSPFLLGATDQLGRTAVDIARVWGWPALERWLQDAVLSSAHSQSHRRSLPLSFAEDFRVADLGNITSSVSYEKTSFSRENVCISGVENLACVHGNSVDSSASTMACTDSETLARNSACGESSELSHRKSAADQITIVPTFNLPPAYKDLLDQIDKTGWRSMNWKNNYTLLHWAAGHGQGALCRYLIQLNANIDLRVSWKKCQ